MNWRTWYGLASGKASGGRDLLGASGHESGTRPTLDIHTSPMYCLAMTTITVKPDARIRDLHLPGRGNWDSERFQEFCELNPDVVAELDAAGDILIMTPSNAKADRKNARLITLLSNWAEQTGFGVVFGPSAGFTLRDGAVRSPDVSLVKSKDWDALSAEEQTSFPALCPWSVVEIRSSPNDPREALEQKMEEYRSCGAALGWFLDPVEKGISIYRPDRDIERLECPAALSGDPELPGFVLDPGPMWD